MNENIPRLKAAVLLILAVVAFDIEHELEPDDSSGKKFGWFGGCHRGSAAFLIFCCTSRAGSWL